MTIRLHRGDLPDLSRYTRRWRSIPRPWGCIRIATGSAWCRCRMATAAPTSCRSRRPHRRAEPEGAAGQPENHENLPFRAVRSGGALQCVRRDAAAGLLHQDRLAADPHLHRPSWPEGPGARGAQHRSVEAAAIERLGAADLSEAQWPMPPPTCCICMRLRERLDAMLAREGRTELAQACFDFLPTRAKLDLAGWDTEDIFAHS